MPQLEQRYFRRNEGTTDYATIPEVTLSGDFVIEIEFMKIGSSSNILLGNSANTQQYLIVNAAGELVLATGNSFNPLATGVLLSVINKLVLSKSSGVVSGTLNGVSVTGFAEVFSLNFDLLYSRSTGLFWSGILSNLRIYDNGTLVRDYPLNDNSSTIRDLANGQDGTIINGNASDWGLFDRQADGDWLGQELLFNGDFSQGASGWSGTVAETVFADNKLYYNGTTNNVIYQNSISNKGEYLVTADIDSFTRNASTPRPQYQVIGNSGYQPITSGVAGLSSIYYSVDDINNGNGYFELGEFGSGAEFVVNSFSVKEVLKNA